MFGQSIFKLPGLYNGFAGKMHKAAVRCINEP